MGALPRILVVDDSRMVRAGLARHLQGQFEVREESDGESAWQTLVLDNAIRAVISGQEMPKLNAYGLLERLRQSRLRRLQEMPFILVSDDEGEEDRLRAKGLGVSDFVSERMGAAEILTSLARVLALSETRADVESGREKTIHDPESGLFTACYLELQAAQALSHAARHGGEVSVLVVGFDALAAMRERLGPSAAAQVTGRFARMLAGKMRHEDSLGHYGDSQYAIVSPGTSPVACALFAERVREAVEVAHVALQGQTLTLTVSIGVAGVPADRVTSAGGLLELAARRMGEAMSAGGNRIVADGAGKLPLKALTVQRALELLAADRASAVRPHLAALGQQMLPLLHLMNEEFALNLPLAVLETRFSDQAKQ